MTQARSSGDMAADRRFALAMGYRADGDLPAAAELMAQALERVPGWAAGWVVLGEIEAERGSQAAAAEAFRSALAADPSDVAGAGPRLSRALGQTPAALPEAHVAALFDDYAPRFDTHLTASLGYRGPDLVVAAIERAAAALGRGAHFERAIDLGCGTGLFARALDGRADLVVGVDLSPAMLDRAAATGLYGALAAGDALAFLKGRRGGETDLIAAVDTFPYLGDLAPIAVEAARALAPDGLLAFTVQRHAGVQPFALGPDLRFAHSEAHVLDALAAARLGLVEMTRAATRRDAGVDVPGLVVVAVKA